MAAESKSEQKAVILDIRGTITDDAYFIPTDVEQEQFDKIDKIIVALDSLRKELQQGGNIDEALLDFVPFYEEEDTEKLRNCVKNQSNQEISEFLTNMITAYQDKLNEVSSQYSVISENRRIPKGLLVLQDSENEKTLGELMKSFNIDYHDNDEKQEDSGWARLTLKQFKDLYDAKKVKSTQTVLGGAKTIDYLKKISKSGVLIALATGDSGRDIGNAIKLFVSKGIEQRFFVGDWAIAADFLNKKFGTNLLTSEIVAKDNKKTRRLLIQAAEEKGDPRLIDEATSMGLSKGNLMYSAILEKLKLSKDNVVPFDDSGPTCEQAKSAGFPAVVHVESVDALFAGFDMVMNKFGISKSMAAAASAVGVFAGPSGLFVENAPVPTVSLAPNAS